MKPYLRKSWSVIRVLVPAMGLAAIVTAAEPAPVPVVTEAGAAAFALPVLPYAQDALAPYISARTRRPCSIMRRRPGTMRSFGSA